MDISDLHYFTAAPDAGSFSSAGKALGRDPSALSRRIGGLEVSRCNASQARSDAKCHGRAPANCGASFRNLQIVDGKHALPDQDAEAGPHRDEPPRSEPTT